MTTIEEEEPTIGVLRRHHLAHLPELEVGASIRDARFVRACDARNCSSVCCKTGVYADQLERARILEHTDAVVRAMDADQSKDPATWFEDEELEDGDFPSGIGIGTEAGPRGCVFLDGTGKCVLQKAHETGLVPVVLKPFYCFAFPITISDGTLIVDADHAPDAALCCQPAAEGERTAVDVFEWELAHVLGAEGLAELKELLAPREP